MSNATGTAQNSPADFDRLLKWQVSSRAQGAIYATRASGGGVKNRGPKGTKRAWCRRRHRTFHYVVRDVALNPGTILPSGQVVPPTGGALRDVAVCPPLQTWRQAKKALARARRHHPGATLISYTSVVRGRAIGTSWIDIPGASAGHGGEHV